MKIPKSSSQNHHVELMHPYIKLVRLNKGIVNDMTTFKQTRKRLNELQLKINEKHRKIRHGEEELEINEELRQLYAEFFENSKREQDLIIAILADLSQLVEKAEERQKEETNSLAQQQQQQQVETQVQTTTPTPTIPSSEQIIVPTSAVSSPSSSSSVPVKDPMQVDEDEETINSQASNSTTQNTSDSEKQTTKARTATGSKGGRNKKGGKSVKEPASSSERKVEASQPITSDKYLQIEEGIPVKSKVAARISGATEESGDSGFWILASILKYYPDKNRYDVIDEDNSDDEESTSTDRKTYKLNKNHIVQLPTDMSQHKLFKKGDKVFAVFPDTTTFYPAIVDSVPTKTSKNYSLKFEDDEEDGKTPTRKVSFKYVISAFDRNKTFKPVKNVQSSHHQELHKKLEATLNKDSYTDMLIQESVKLPPTETVNEWISFHMIEFYNKINGIFGQMQECCTDESCPKMMSSPGYMYLWRDSSSKKYKKATEVSAPEYIALSIDKIESLLNDTSIFSTSGDFPKEFRKTVKDMCKKIFRIYAHVFHHHYSEVTDRKMEANFLFAFKHFLFFAMEFRLLNEKELEPMIPWVEKSTGIDVEKYLKSKKKEKHNQKKSGESSSSSTSSSSSANNSSSGDLNTSSEDKQPKKRNGHKRNDSLRAEDFNLIRRRSASVMAPNDNIQSHNSNLSAHMLNTSSDSNNSTDSEKAIYAIEPNKISTLLVEVIEASNLDAKNTNDTSDGFAVLKFEGQEVKTEVIWKELNPKWNERFTFIVKNISSNLHIAVYDENRLSKAQLIGVIDFNCQELADEVKHDLWVDLKNKETNNFAGRIHLKCIFTSSESGSMGYLKKITNLNFYDPLKEFLVNASPSVFIGLFDNNKLNIDDKIYKSLIYLTTYGDDKSTTTEAFNVSVMKYIIRLEVEKTIRISQLLRSNTISTKLVGMYLKIFGQGYLKKTLQELTQKICEEDRFLECSPDAIRKEDSSLDPDSKAKDNLNEIISYARQYMQLIKNSVLHMPPDIRQITSHLREQVMKKYEGTVTGENTSEGSGQQQQLDSASMGTIAATSLLFLRFITPCITAPHLFQLVQTIPQKNAQRTLMLVSKILQQLANETEFSEKKEAFMVPANEFLREQKSILRGFLDDVCDVNKDGFTLRKSTDGSESEENNDRLLWSLYNIHVLFYDNDSNLFPLLQESKKKGTTAQFSYFELNNENAEELADKYDQLRNVVARLGSPPQLSLATRQKIATAFSKRSDTEIPAINLN